MENETLLNKRNCYLGQLFTQGERHSVLEQCSIFEEENALMFFVMTNTLGTDTRQMLGFTGARFVYV